MPPRPAGASAKSVFFEVFLSCSAETGCSGAEEPMVCVTLRWRRESAANSSLKHTDL
jgi:hypothetical protein